MSEVPFKVGDRVRTTAAYRAEHPQRRFRTGVVTRVRIEMVTDWDFADGPDLLAAPRRPIFAVRARRDGPGPSKFDEFLWYAEPRPGGGFERPALELLPPADWTLDDVLTGLIEAARTGDRAAALALAVRVFELCGGTRGG